LSTFVIVHGAWGGGWEWTPVARLLRDRGHEVFTPTLTGLGDRAHLAQNEYVGLATHVADVVAVLEFENLREVVLCRRELRRDAGHGRGRPHHGAHRVSHSTSTHWCLSPASRRSICCPRLSANTSAAVSTNTVPTGEFPYRKICPKLFSRLARFPDQVRADYFARVRDQPAATFIEPLPLTGSVEHLRRAFVRCTTGQMAARLGDDRIEACARRARTDGWTYRELAAPHDPQVFDPAGIAAILDELTVPS